MSAEQRCVECGALLSADAQWCGQCLTPVRPEPEPEAQPAPASAVELAPSPVTSDESHTAPPERPAAAPAPESWEGATTAAYWACPVCGEENSLDAPLCSVCGTPFARLFDEEPGRARVSAAAASRAGLIPGLGHIRAGRAGEGVARMVVFSVALAFLLMFLLADAGTWSLVVTAVYIVFSFALVAESWLDAGRIAAGERQLISGRNLLWVAVALLGVSVGIVVLLSVGVRPEGG